MGKYTAKKYNAVQTAAVIMKSDRNDRSIGIVPFAFSISDGSGAAYRKVLRYSAETVPA